jgi:hypothetical protein
MNRREAPRMQAADKPVRSLVNSGTRDRTKTRNLPDGAALSHEA